MTQTDAPSRPRFLRAAAVGAAVSLATTAVAFAGTAPAQAASNVYAQSVGRFLDGRAGGKPIQTIVDLRDARASAPGRPSEQNPLNARLFGQADIPIGHHLQLPGGGAFHLGAANQVAVARNSGFAYGASGAVSNSGGGSLGGNNGAYPADARIDLTSQRLGSAPIPGLPKLPGAPGIPAGRQPALGGVSAEVGAVAALAKTEAGGSFAAPRYKIASLSLVLSSPALAALLKQLAAGGKQLQPVLDKIYGALQTLGLSMPPGCRYNPGVVPPTLSLDSGAVVMNPASGSISIDLAALLRTLGANLNSLPPNTDLLAYVLHNLGRILSHGLAHVVSGITDPVRALGQNCVRQLQSLPGIGSLVQTLTQQLATGQQRLQRAVDKIAAQLSKAGAPGLSQLTDNLGKVVALGVNVQQGAFPLAGEPAPRYRFLSALGPTPDQATAIVPGQGVVRALEIKVANGQGASIALGNAAAGPGSSPAQPPTSSPPAPVPSTAIPTGVPAGNAAGPGGSSPLPLIMLLAAAAIGGLGAIAYRVRGHFSR